MCLAGVMALAAPIAQAQGANDWSGFYYGATAGKVNGESEWATSNFIIQTGDFDVDGSAFGLFAGQNFQYGNLVLGYEGEVSRANATGITTNLCSGCRTSFDGFATFKGRAGYGFNNSLIYGTFGVAIGHFEESLPGPVSETESTTGFVAGVGYEHMVTGGWSLRGEYQVLELGRLSNSLAGPLIVDVDPIEMFRIGLSRKF